MIDEGCERERQQRADGRDHKMIDANQFRLQRAEQGVVKLVRARHVKWRNAKRRDVKSAAEIADDRIDRRRANLDRRCDHPPALHKKGEAIVWAN